MPITTMEDLARVEPGGKIEYEGQPYWRVDADWWTTSEGGAATIREAFWSGAVATGKVLATGEVEFRRGLVYQLSEGQGSKIGILLERDEATGRWTGLRLKPDGTYLNIADAITPEKIVPYLLDPQPPQLWVDAVVAMWEKWVAADEAKQDLVGRVVAAESAQRLADRTIKTIAGAVEAVTKYTSGAMDPGTGLIVGDMVRTQATLTLLPEGAVIQRPQGTTYTKRADNQWDRQDGRIINPIAFGTLSGMTLVSLPTSPQQDEVTGLKVGDVVTTVAQFVGLPVGTRVEFYEDTACQQATGRFWEKRGDGQWQEMDVVDAFRAESLSLCRNRIVSLPVQVNPTKEGQQ